MIDVGMIDMCCGGNCLKYHSLSSIVLTNSHEKSFKMV